MTVLQRGVIRLAHMIQSGWSNNGHLCTGEAEQPVAAQSMMVDATAIPTWQERPGAPRELLVFMLEKPKKLGSDDGEGWTQHQH